MTRQQLTDQSIYDETMTVTTVNLTTAKWIRSTALQRLTELTKQAMQLIMLPDQQTCACHFRALQGGVLEEAP